MNRNDARQKSVFAFAGGLLLIFFGLGEAALSQTSAATNHQAAADSGTASTKNARDLTVSGVVISPDVGYVLETHAPSGQASQAPIIIHIQEAHANYEAQLHLIDILTQLVDAHGLRLILVEGGRGDVGLSYLRDYGPPENRKDVAEKYLKLGVLSGEEYLDIVSDYPLILWGVEDPQLYEQHVSAFLETELLGDALAPLLERFGQAVEALKSRADDPTLQELEAKRAAFDQQSVGLGDYAEFLRATAERQRVGLSGYPQVDRFLTLRDLERAIDMSRVPGEQRELVTRLSTLIPAEEIDALIQGAQEMKAKTLPPEQFYARLQEAAERGGVNLRADYAHLADYIHYVTLKPQLAATVLADELTALVEDLRDQLITASGNRELYAVSDQVELVQQLVKLKLSPEEYARFRSLSSATLVSQWVKELEGQSRQAGLPPQSFEGAERLQAALPRLEAFYEAANARDAALVDRTLSKLKETGERLAVLITGGFHAPQITARLKEAGVGIVAVAPKVGEGSDEALYHAVLKYKSGHGSFTDVEAAARRAGLLEEMEP